MTVVISKTLYDELKKNARSSYPACAQTIKSMYQRRANRAGQTLTDEQLDQIVIRILGKRP